MDFPIWSISVWLYRAASAIPFFLTPQTVIVWVLVMGKQLWAVFLGTTSVLYRQILYKFTHLSAHHLCALWPSKSLFFHLKVAQKNGRSLHQDFQQNCISLRNSRKVFGEKHVCLQSLMMSWSCSVCPCFLCTIPSNSEKRGTAGLRFHTLFCICNRPGCMYKAGLWLWRAQPATFLGY